MGTAVGLAVFVGIARSGIGGVTGTALQERLGDGVRLGLVVAAGLIVASIVVALTVRPSASVAPAVIEQSDTEVCVRD